MTRPFYWACAQSQYGTRPRACMGLGSPRRMIGTGPGACMGLGSPRRMIGTGPGACMGPRSWYRTYTNSLEVNKVHRFTQKYSYTNISDIQNFLISLKKLLYTNFGIGDVMTSTTPVTTLGEPLSYVCRTSDEDSTPSG